MASIPSIALIPSGYKASKLYSVLPTNGNADLTVVRNSTANRINKDGLIESMAVNVPLLDHSNGTCPSLLLQPQSTNLITYPLSFDNAYWTISGATVTSGFSAPSVDNPTSAFKLVTTSNSSLLYRGSTGSTGENTVSVYAKSNTSSDQKFRFFGNGNTLVSDDKIANQDWQRFEFTGTFSSVTWGIKGASVSETNDILIFGYQHEVQSYATSLMLPATEGSTTTRLKDEVSKTGLSAEIGQTEGTIFLDFIPQTLDATSRFLSIENSSSASNGWMGVFAKVASGNIRFRFYGDGWDFNSTLIVERDTRYKIAVSYENGVQTSAYVNGNLIGNLTASLSGKSFQKIRLSEAAFGVRGDANFNDFRLYKTALTDAELTTLTTI